MYLVEIVGTTIFMLAVLSGNWLVIGASLSVLVYLGGLWGVVAYNPAIVLMLCTLKKMKWSEGIRYLVCEIIGVALAVILYKLIK
jgi:glycerol uptake facilitator-like aquaporin